MLEKNHTIPEYNLFNIHYIRYVGNGRSSKSVRIKQIRRIIHRKWVL